MASFSVVIVTAPPFFAGADPASSLIKVDGREALLRSVELFLNRDEIKQIQLIVPSEKLEEIKRRHGGHLGFSGVKLSAAAAKYTAQAAAAVEKLSPEVSHVIVHDAARPAVAYSDIDALESASEKGTVVALCSPLRHALVQLDEGRNPVGLVAASDYAQIMLPLAMKREKFIELAQANREPHAAELTLIAGSALNVRVSSASDAGVTKAMISMLPKPKTRGPLTPFDEAQW